MDLLCIPLNNRSSKHGFGRAMADVTNSLLYQTTNENANIFRIMAAHVRTLHHIAIAYQIL